MSGYRNQANLLNTRSANLENIKSIVKRQESDAAPVKTRVKSQPIGEIASSFVSWQSPRRAPAPQYRGYRDDLPQPEQPRVAQGQLWHAPAPPRQCADAL